MTLIFNIKHTPQTMKNTFVVVFECTYLYGHSRWEPYIMYLLLINEFSVVIFSFIIFSEVILCIIYVLVIICSGIGLSAAIMARGRRPRVIMAALGHITASNH